MTDPGREVPFAVGGRAYTLYAGNRALRLIERETGASIQQALHRLQTVDLTVMTTLLWSLLQQKHADEFPGIDDVDDLIDAAGYEALGEAIQAAVERAFPEAVEAAANASPNGAKPGKPRRAGTGTGSPRAPSRPG